MVFFTFKNYSECSFCRFKTKIHIKSVKYANSLQSKISAIAQFCEFTINDFLNYFLIFEAFFLNFFNLIHFTNLFSDIMKLPNFVKQKGSFCLFDKNYPC